MSSNWGNISIRFLPPPYLDGDSLIGNTYKLSNGRQYVFIYKNDSGTYMKNVKSKQSEWVLNEEFYKAPSQGLSLVSRRVVLTEKKISITSRILNDEWNEWLR